MTERNIAAEVLKGLQEVKEHRVGKRALRETRTEATPLSERARRDDRSDAGPRLPSRSGQAPEKDSGPGLGPRRQSRLRRPGRL